MNQDKQAEIKFFDEFGEESGYDVITEAGYQRILRELAPYNYIADPSVIDLGCGTGSFTERLSRIFPKVIGLDISPQCINYASKKYPHIAFETGDLESLPYADNSFDLITMFGVLHHFPRMEDALKEPYRILKDNGILFVYDPNINNPFFWVYHSESSPLYSAKSITKNEKLFSRGQLQSALEVCGFKLDKLFCISGVTLDSRHKKYSGRVKPFVHLYNAAEILFDFPLFNNIFGSSIIGIARKKEKGQCLPGQ